MSDDEPEVDPDQMDIMVATDCHLGYEERDPVRGLDSFAAFEEVLLLAKSRKVDFVLLGDLTRKENSKHVMMYSVDCSEFMLHSNACSLLKLAQRSSIQACSAR
jgi:hypothetical protein